MSEQYVINPKTNRRVKTGTQAFRRLVREGVIQDPRTIKVVKEPIEVVEVVKEPIEVVETAPVKPIDGVKLQTKLLELSTDAVANNIRKIVASQHLTEKEMDVMLKRLLYNKLCIVWKVLFIMHLKEPQYMYAH